VEYAPNTNIGIWWKIGHIRGGHIGEREGKMEVLYLMYYKKFCKCHNVPLPSRTIKKMEKKEGECVWCILYTRMNIEFLNLLKPP
jgi:hypothetical protein